MKMNRTFARLLLCGAATASFSTAAFAIPKPVASYNQCQAAQGVLVLVQPPEWVDQGCGYRNETYDVICQIDGNTVDDLQCGMTQGPGGDVPDMGSIAAQNFMAQYPDYTLDKRSNTGGMPFQDLYATRNVTTSSEDGGCGDGGSSDPHTYVWQTNPGTASGCGVQEVPQNVSCYDQTYGYQVDESFCDASTRPDDTKTQETYDGCTYTSTTGPWVTSDPSCGQALMFRSVGCQRSDGVMVSNATCTNQHAIEALHHYPSNYSGPSPFFWTVSSNPYDGSPANVFTPDMPAACMLSDQTQIEKQCDVSYILPRVHPDIVAVDPYSSVTYNDARACTGTSQTDAKYQWNSPVYTPEEPSCGINFEDAGDIHCTDTTDGTTVDDSFCDPSSKPLAKVQFDDSRKCYTPPTAQCVYAQSSAFGSNPTDQVYQACKSQYGYSSRVTDSYTAIQNTDGSLTFCSGDIQSDNSGYCGANYLSSNSGSACSRAGSLPSCSSPWSPGTGSGSTPSGGNLCQAAPTSGDCVAKGYTNRVSHTTLYQNVGFNSYYNCLDHERQGQCCQVSPAESNGTSTDVGTGFTYVDYYTPGTCQ